MKSGPGRVDELDWLSYHIFYHSHLEVLLLELVRPAVGGLWLEGLIDSFYFIRYALGGPHLRLRVHPRPGCQDVVRATIESKVAAFLASSPSPSSRSEEEIRRENRAILAGDPQEQGDAVYPNNSFASFPIRLETERYGGPELLGASLDVFALSSVQALRFVAECRDEPPARRLTRAFGLLARQALGLAGNRSELLDLLDYAAQSWPNLARLGARAGQVYEQRSEAFRQLLRAEIQASGAPGRPSLMIEGAGRLAREIAGAPAGARRRIGGSHLHMTANRIGLLNTDEIYLGGLLVRAARDLTTNDPACCGQLDSLLSRQAELDDSLGDLLGRACADLFMGPED